MHLDDFNPSSLEMALLLKKENERFAGIYSQIIQADQILENI